MTARSNTGTPLPVAQVHHCPLKQLVRPVQDHQGSGLSATEVTDFSPVVFQGYQAPSLILLLRGLRRMVTFRQLSCRGSFSANELAGHDGWGRHPRGGVLRSPEGGGGWFSATIGPSGISD